MNLMDLQLTDGELAMVHGGMTPKSGPPGGGVVSHAASEAYSQGAHHNAKAFANNPAYHRSAAIGAMSVINPYVGAKYVANKVVAAVMSGGKGK